MVMSNGQARKMFEKIQFSNYIATEMELLSEKCLRAWIETHIAALQLVFYKE